MKVCIALFALFAVGMAADPNCLRACPMIYMPVCGSNGKTYSNTCVMSAAACEAKATITMARNGPCEKMVAASTTWEPMTTTQALNTKCLTICPMIWFPVCGSDGKTYGNECEMKSRACMAKSTITRAHQGPC